jgi:hypothetical protein
VQSTAHNIVVQPLPDNPGQVVNLSEQDITVGYDHTTVSFEYRQKQGTVVTNLGHKIHIVQDPWDIIVPEDYMGSVNSARSLASCHESKHQIMVIMFGCILSAVGASTKDTGTLVEVVNTASTDSTVAEISR